MITMPIQMDQRDGEEPAGKVTDVVSARKSKLALSPKHAERVCWGCDRYCSASDLRCGNGTIRTQHPAELFGEDWLEWELASPGESKVEPGTT